MHVRHRQRHRRPLPDVRAQGLPGETHSSSSMLGVTRLLAPPLGDAAPGEVRQELPGQEDCGSLVQLTIPAIRVIHFTIL